MACRRREAHCSDSKLYDDYYLKQVGSGLPVFVGGKVQRGHGLGNIFSGLARAAMPLLKSGVKALGKQGMKTGLQIAGDVFRGQQPKRAVRRRGKQAGKQLLHKALREIIPLPPGRPQKQQRGIKRRAQRRSVSSTRASKRSRSQKDIFS